MEKKTITVLMVEPHRHPYLKTVEHTLENLQGMVGGYITATYPWEDLIGLVADDDGLFKQEYEWIGSLMNTRSYGVTSFCVDLDVRISLTSRWTLPRSTPPGSGCLNHSSTSTAR